MTVNFEKLDPATIIARAESYGIRYKKYQKNDIIRSYNINNPTMDEINFFCKKNKIDLSDDYKNFLVKFNGGTPDKSIFRIADFECVLNSLLMLASAAGIYYSIENYMENYKLRIPSVTVPIGYSPGGDLFLMKTSEPDFGVIYYWRHDLEAEFDGRKYWGNVEKIASNFSAFLDGLESE